MKQKGDSICGSPIRRELKYGEESSVVLSIMYGLLVVVLAVVFKVSENISTHQNEKVVIFVIQYQYVKAMSYVVTVI